MIYHFKKSELGSQDFYQNAKECVELIIGSFEDEILIDPKQIKQLQTIYGKEALAIAINLHPYKKATLSSKEAFTGWKIMNKIYTASIKDNVSSQASENIMKYYHWAKKSQINKKNHTYISAIIHIVNEIIKSDSGVYTDHSQILFDLTKNITPFLYK
jgi:hypothetical protein